MWSYISMASATMMVLCTDVLRTLYGSELWTGAIVRAVKYEARVQCRCATHVFINAVGYMPRRRSAIIEALHEPTVDSFYQCKQKFKTATRLREGELFIYICSFKLIFPHDVAYCLCRRAVSVRSSVCLSVRLSWLSKRVNIFSKFFHSHSIFSRTKLYGNIPTGSP